MGKRVPTHLIQINQRHKVSKEECIARILERDKQEEKAEKDWRESERHWKKNFDQWWARRIENINRALHTRRLAIQGTLAKHGPSVVALTLQDWNEIKARYRHKCAYCQQRKPLTKDHIVPISKGGFHTKLNVIPACASCNSKKGDRPAFLYKPTLIPF